MSRLTPSQVGALCAALGVIFFGINDTAIKFLSGGYALHQIVLIRSVLGLILVMVCIAPFNGGWAVFRTAKLGLHVIRGCMVVAANLLLFLGLSSMPLADAVAIFFISPLLITVFSVIFLREVVGIWRWGAVGIGFIGVLIMVRPGGDTFQAAAFFPLTAAVFYAGLHIMTRFIGDTETAATMSVYVQMVFIVFSVVVGLSVGDGRFADQDGAALSFLLRAWSWPPVSDWPIFAVVGIGVAFGGYLISHAYRVAEAALVAPFEYVAMPLAVILGIVIFGDWPTPMAYLGMVLIVAAGVITVWRETGKGTAPVPPRLRR